MAQHTASKTSTTGSPLGVVGSVLSFLALVLAVLAAAVLIIVPMATGSQTYSVLTNSMRPHLPPGTLLVSKPVLFQDLEVGDVITYQLESGQADVITHRIVTTSADQEGNTLLITQGDNNSLPDDEPVRDIQVRGKLFYAVPYAGFLANWLGNQNRGMGAQIAALVLIGYGAWNVVAGIVTRRRKSRELAAEDGSRVVTVPEECAAGRPEMAPSYTGHMHESAPMPAPRPLHHQADARHAFNTQRPGRRRRERVSR